MSIIEPTTNNPYAVSVAAPLQESRVERGNAAAAATEAAEIARIKGQIVIAKQCPRDPFQSTNRILAECGRPTLAEKANYSYQRGTETVSGPSIRLAEVIARAWGNVDIGARVLERGNGRTVAEAYAWDLETNTRISRVFEIAHFRETKSGGYKLTSDRDIRELEANIASRYMRQCILQVVPGDVVDAATSACRSTLANALADGLKTPDARAKTVRVYAKAFEGFGVTLHDLEALLGHASQQWTVEDLQRMTDIGNALKDGAATIGDYWPHLVGGGRNAVITKEQAAEIMGMVGKAGKSGDFSTWLKKQGISKIADIPAGLYDAAKAEADSYQAPQKEAQQ